MYWKYATNVHGQLRPEDTSITAMVEGPGEEEAAEELARLMKELNRRRAGRGKQPVKFTVVRKNVPEPMSDFTEGGADNAEREGRLPSDL